MVGRVLAAATIGKIGPSRITTERVQPLYYGRVDRVYQTPDSVGADVVRGSGVTVKKNQPTVDEMARGVFDEINSMIGKRIRTSRGYEIMPPVASFSHLHDYMDANVGWLSIESDDEDYPLVGFDMVDRVFDKVDSMLFTQFTAGMVERGWVSRDGRWHLSRDGVGYAIRQDDQFKFVVIMDGEDTWNEHHLASAVSAVEDYITAINEG